MKNGAKAGYVKTNDEEHDDDAKWRSGIARVGREVDVYISSWVQDKPEKVEEEDGALTNNQ